MSELEKTRDSEAPWWAFLANPPNSRSDPSWDRLMRVFADPTAPESWGAYNPRSEGHQVVNFFENFRLDRRHIWIRWLLSRIGDDQGSVSAAAWSYELEDPKTSLLGDLVIGFSDEGGPGVIVIECKRTSEKLPKGLSAKDDPTQGGYLEIQQFSDVARKYQLLLVTSEAVANLPPAVRSSGRLITWEEIGVVQRTILEAAAKERPDFRRAIRLHHALLGIRLRSETCRLPETPGELDQEPIEWLMQGIDAYANFVKRGRLIQNAEWLRNEPGRSDLIKREAQTGADRQRAYWRQAFTS